MFQSSSEGDTLPGGSDMCKIRYGVFNAYFSRLLNVVFVGEQGKILCPMTGWNIKYHRINDSHADRG